MATRDLTVPYLRLRSALHRKAPGRFDEGGNTNLLAGGAAPGGVDSAPLAGLQGASPVYVDMVTDVQSDVNGIQMKSAWGARGGLAMGAHAERDPSAEQRQGGEGPGPLLLTPCPAPRGADDARARTTHT
jgi:hypothetical protein